ncbi:MAG TPA: hypothetical protein V6C84_15355 [Coleofasciculaceae cyanobacterium]
MNCRLRRDPSCFMLTVCLPLTDRLFTACLPNGNIRILNPIGINALFGLERSPQPLS